MILSEDCSENGIMLAVRAEEEATEDDIALIANFTFVARDSVTKKAAQVNRLQPESVAEKKLFQEGEGRDERRKARMKDLSEGMRVGKVPYDAQKMQALLREGRVLIEMPTLADRNSILIRDTRLENAIVCQPQQRNMHGRIFGGFLMRRAYELSYTTCYVFCGTKPVFLEVDHVDFRRPVLANPWKLCWLVFLTKFCEFIVCRNKRLQFVACLFLP